MTLNGIVVSSRDTSAVIYNRKQFVLVTHLNGSLPTGSKVKVGGRWYEKHYLRHDFTDGYVDAFRAEAVVVR